MTIAQEISYKIAYAHGLVTRARFRAACRDAARRQQETLRRILWRHRETAFGREHGFANVARDVEAYRQAVPIRDYEGHRPWIDRVLAGEQGVLWHPGDSLEIFSQTSGTTSRPKLIPITSSWLAAYRRTSLVWGMFLVRDYPKIFSGKILQVTGAAREGMTPLGVPIGSASAMHARTQKRVVQSYYVLPGSVFDIDAYEDRYRVIGRLSLTQPVTLLATANPSTVLRLVRCIDERSEDLIRAVHDGDLGEGFALSAEERRRLEATLRPDPDAARRLERMRSAAGGHLRPRDYWPRLLVLAHWLGGPLASYLSEYPTWFREEMPLRDIGLLASEARMTVPVEDGSAAGLLDIEHLFFEFIPLAEAEAEEPTTLLAHEVEVGQEYLLVFTSCAGLYRYDIADVVRVTGFLGQTPLVAFLHKGRHITSVTGEKLSEHQVVEAARIVGRERGGQPAAFVVYPEERTDTVPGYVLSMEPQEEGSRKGWARAYDQALGEQNLEYAAKRASGRLGPIRLQEVAAGTFEELRRARLAQGGSFEQYKHVYLHARCPGELLHQLSGQQGGQTATGS